MGEDILLSEPNVLAARGGHERQLEFLVIQEPFLNETTRFADVILPAAVFAEKDGVFTNSERRVQRVRKAVEPPGEARADWEILLTDARAGVRRRVGATRGSDEVYAEMVEPRAEVRGHQPRAPRPRAAARSDRAAVAVYRRRRPRHRVPPRGRRPARARALPGRGVPALRRAAL